MVDDNDIVRSFMSRCGPLVMHMIVPIVICWLVALLTASHWGSHKSWMAFVHISACWVIAFPHFCVPHWLAKSFSVAVAKSRNE